MVSKRVWGGGGTLVVESAIVRIVCPGCDGRRYKTIERRWVVSRMTGQRSIIFLATESQGQGPTSR
jgi:hypothetical protein